ncbi:hypothetical protein PGT21_005988 [Puccinia graminis f. sp. tritici]|uniref:Uncharacterized protein n=1 Tax=Puccinia graminis f. sp. tritici TaxID=56615 RepID=A0A5B0Q9Z2_PUCGR|nr:hypothetical protein PGT21_005988 [Puccinia graminis f. sp. tritici]
MDDLIRRLIIQASLASYYGTPGATHWCLQRARGLHNGLVARWKCIQQTLAINAALQAAWMHHDFQLGLVFELVEASALPRSITIHSDAG